MAKFLNAFFLTLTAFAATFCWIYYATKLPKISLAAALCAAVAAGAALYLFKAPVGKKKQNAAKRKNAEALAMQFTLYGDGGVIADAFSFLGYAVQNTEKGFTAEKEEKIYAEDAFSLTPLSADRTIEISKRAKAAGCDRAVIFCAKYSPDAEKMAQMTEIPCRICPAESLYLWLERLQKLPPLTVKKRAKSHPTLNFAFNKRCFGYYALSSLFLFAVSFFSYFPIYTLIWGTVMAALAVYARVNGRFNQKETAFDL